MKSRRPKRLKLIARGEYKLNATSHSKDELAVASELAYDITQLTLQSLFPQ